MKSNCKILLALGVATLLLLSGDRRPDSQLGFHWSPWGKGAPCYSWVRLEVQALHMVSSDTTGWVETEKSLENTNKEVNNTNDPVRWSNTLLLEAQKEGRIWMGPMTLLWFTKLSGSDIVPVTGLALNFHFLPLRALRCCVRSPGYSAGQRPRGGVALKHHTGTWRRHFGRWHSWVLRWLQPQLLTATAWKILCENFPAEPSQPTDYER